MNNLWIINIDDINKGTGQAIRMKNLLLNLSKYYNISLITSTKVEDVSIVKRIKKLYHCKNLRIFSDNIKNPLSFLFLFNLLLCINRFIKDEIPIYTDSHLVAFFIKKFGRKNPVITECHGSNAEELVSKKIFSRNCIFYKIISRIEKIDWNLADGIIANDQQTKKMLIEKGVNLNKIFIGTNGVDTRIFNIDIDGSNIRQKLSIGKDFVMIYIGSYRSWHGIDNLLYVLKKLNDKFQDVKLLLVGDGPERKNIEDKVKSLNITDNIIFIDYLPHNEIPKYIAAADICPYFPPDTSEEFTRSFSGTPIKFFEYLSMGKPIVTTDQPEFNFITENKCGIITNNKLDDFTNAIGNLINNKKMRKQLGDNGIKFINKERTWYKITKDIQKFINLYSCH